MADRFQESDLGSDGNNGTTFALGKATLPGLLGVMSAGDRGWYQGATDDTAAAARTFTSPGTIFNPCIIMGVIDGTTNEPPLLADIAVTLPKISNTGGTNALTFNGFAVYINIDFSTVGRMNINAATTFINCKVSHQDRFNISTGAVVTLINCERETLGSTAEFFTDRNGRAYSYGGSVVFTVAANIAFSSAQGDIECYGVDLSGLTLPIATAGSAKVKIVNCKMPATFTLFAGTPNSEGVSVEVISSDNSTSVGATDSIQDYQYQDTYGNVDAEFTVVRTGGANDGASGLFARAMTPAINSTLPSSYAAIKSQWIPFWVEAGNQDVALHIANDSASTDFNEDEVFMEIYSPNSNDTAQHEQNFVPDGARLFASSTALTDDTGSTWGTGGNNHQIISKNLVPGFEGEAYLRLHYLKRFSSSAVTLYFDPLPVVS